MPSLVRDFIDNPLEETAALVREANNPVEVQRELEKHADYLGKRDANDARWGFNTNTWFDAEFDVLVGELGGDKEKLRKIYVNEFLRHRGLGGKNDVNYWSERPTQALMKKYNLDDDALIRLVGSPTDAEISIAVDYMGSVS